MSPTGVLVPRVGKLPAPGSAVAPTRGHLHRPRFASGAEIAAGGLEAASCAVTVLGEMGGRGGRAPRGGGSERGRAASLLGGEKGAKGGGEPGGPELLLLLPSLPGARRATLPP